METKAELEFTAEYFNRKCGEGLTVDEMAIKAIQLENSVELWPAANNDKETSSIIWHVWHLSVMELGIILM